MAPGMDVPRSAEVEDRRGTTPDLLEWSSPTCCSPWGLSFLQAAPPWGLSFLRAVPHGGCLSCGLFPLGAVFPRAGVLGVLVGGNCIPTIAGCIEN